MPREAYSYRSDPTVPAFPDDRPIIIFDGKCVFCSVFARFILRSTFFQIPRESEEVKSHQRTGRS